MTADPAPAWLAAIADPAIASALESIYADTAREIETRSPACWASGRCCNFQKTGHLLYVTGLETAYTISRLPPTVPTPSTLLPLLSDAVRRGDCPFLRGNLCGIHTIKPFGCRVYFCDRSAQQWQQDLSERMLARLRAIHDTHAIEYRYGEWRSMLALFLTPAPGASA